MGVSVKPHSGSGGRPRLMQKPALKFTYRDYALLPEGDRRELIDGDFYVAAAPSIKHQIIALNIGVALRAFVRDRGAGIVLTAPTDVVFSNVDVVQPDVLFVSDQHRGIVTEDNIQGAPDLVIEVLSPSTASHDRELKLRLYARFGVVEYWIVDPHNETVQALRLQPAGQPAIRTYTEGPVVSETLPGFSMELSAIFSEE